MTFEIYDVGKHHTHTHLLRSKAQFRTVLLSYLNLKITTKSGIDILGTWLSSYTANITGMDMRYNCETLYATRNLILGRLGRFYDPRKPTTIWWSNYGRVWGMYTWCVKSCSTGNTQTTSRAASLWEERVTSNVYHHSCSVRDRLLLQGHLHSLSFSSHRYRSKKKSTTMPHTMCVRKIIIG